MHKTYKTIFERAEEILRTEHLCDVEFRFSIQDRDNGKNYLIQTLQAHKIILAVASPVFERMFFGSFSESQPTLKTKLNITDIKREIFQMALSFIYIRKFKATNLFENAVDLLYFADKYEISELKDFCTENIIKLFNTGNVIETYEVGKLYALESVKTAAMNLIKERTEVIFKSPHFMKAQIETISDIFDQDDLNVNSELSIFVALEVYVKHNRGFGELSWEQLRSKFLPLVQKVRFLSMKINEFNDVPMKSKLLTEMQKLKIFNNITCRADSTYDYPDEFTCNWFLRNQNRLIQLLKQTLEESNGKPYQVKNLKAALGTLLCEKNTVIEGQQEFLTYLRKHKLFKNSNENADNFLLRVIMQNHVPVLRSLTKLVRINRIDHLLQKEQIEDW